MDVKVLDQIYEERGAIYGNAVATHADIAKLWSALLQDKLTEDLGASDVAFMFVVFKALRGVKAAHKGVHHADTFYDIINYARIAHDCEEGGLG